MIDGPGPSHYSKVMPSRATSSITLLAITHFYVSCAPERDPDRTTTSPPPVTTNDDDNDADGADSADDEAGAGALECTFPNLVTICGCGNACGDYSGYCEDCGYKGEGCALDDIICCADSHCPAGTQCTTLSGDITPDGYHFCYALDSCERDDDCTIGDVCRLGYCRDDT